MSGAPSMRHWLGALALLVSLGGEPAAAESDPVARGLSIRAVEDARVRDRIDVLRRAAQQAAIGNAEDADLASGVTMTVSASTDATLANSYVAGTNPGLFATSGGRATSAGGTGGNQYLYFPVASVAPATNGNLSGALTAHPDYAAWGWAAAFATDSDRIEFRLSSCSTCYFRVQVDGRYVTKSGTAGINYVAYVVLDFAGVRRPRTITVEASDTNALRGVSVRATSNVWRPAGQTDRIVALAAGDSYSEGQGASSPGLFAWPVALGHLMGWTDVRQVAVGGTGYLNPASSLGRSKISAQIGRWLTVNDDLAAADVDIVTIAAGYNDYAAISGVTYTPTEIATEALADWRAIRALLPDAMIVVMGPHAGTRGPDTRTKDIETAFQVAFGQWRDSNALFVPITGSSAGTTPWLFGTGKVGATNGSGNSDFAVSPDGVHPSDAGHSLYARRAAAAIRAALAAKP